MIQIDDKTQCAGCGACVAACPQRCIALREDEEGFRYPYPDADRCAGCNTCERVCPLRAPRQAFEKPQAYAAWHRDVAIRAQSTSGGVFTALAQKMLSRGGVVFGAAFDGERLLHRAVDTAEGLEALPGSKYLPSDAIGAYTQARALLDEGKPVLFCGTPCQVAALKALVGSNAPGLVTCEVLCHGVPAEKVFRRYIQHVGGGQLLSGGAAFRDKARGWRAFGMRLNFEQGKPYVRTQRQDPFLTAYLKNLCLRPSCHACTFAGARRQADLTLGDFWGVGRHHPGWDDDRGTSLVLANTPAGSDLLLGCAEELVLHPCDVSLALPGNPTLTRPTAAHSQREAFLRDVDALPFEQLQRKYLRPRKTGSLPRRALSGAVRLVRRWMRSGK